MASPCTGSHLSFVVAVAMSQPLSACGGDRPDDMVPCVVGEAIAEVGTGTLDFESLPDGPELGVIAGPQGGHHVILHARMTGLSPGDPSSPGLNDNPATRFAVFRGDLAIDLEQPEYRLGYQDTGDGFLALPSGRIVQIEESALGDLDGELIRVEVEIQDASGACARDQADAIAVLLEAGAPDAGP